VASSDFADDPADAVIMSRKTYAAVTALAVFVAMALIGTSVLGVNGKDPAEAPKVAGADTAALLEGIPQKGPVLGRPDAPVTLVEFADLQCPYCARWSQLTFAEIVDDYVRTGKLRIVFNGLAFIGPDSEEALRFAHAAGRQGRFWNAVHLLYANQGSENSGWVDDELMSGIGAATPGLRTSRALDERSSARVEKEIASSIALAERYGVRGTPTFAAGRSGRPPAILPVRSLEPEGIRPFLDQLLAG
jgi:protein-disulfide isomerase